MIRVRVLSLVAALVPMSAVGVGLAVWGAGATTTAASGRDASTTAVGVGAPSGTSAAGIHSGTALAGPSALLACPGQTGTTGVATTAEPARHLFTRTTDDGVTIRAYRLVGPNLAGCGPVGVAWGSSAVTKSQSTYDMPVSTIACGSDQVSIEMSDAAAVGQGEIGPPTAIPSPLAVSQGSSAPVRSGTTPPTAAAPSAARATSSGAFGVVEGDPVWWVGVLVGHDVAQVEVTLPDGSTDHMAPIDGVAVVAHHIMLARASLNADPYLVRGAIHLFDASGRVLAALTLPVVPPTVPGPLTTVPPANPGGPVASGPIGSSVGGSPGQSGGANAGASGPASPPSHAALSSGVMTICPRILAPNVPQAGARGTPAVVSGSARSGP